MQEDNTEIKILSLNGGGARGLFTINVLAEIERIIEQETGRSDVKAGEYFDLITGTSIGGILALGLASGKSARELENTFRSQAPLIFPKINSIWKKIKATYSPRYCNKPLYDAIATMIGTDITFGDLMRRVIIPAVNLSTGKPQFFKTPHNPIFNRDARLKLIDAAMATSAAPTYFAPHHCKDLDAYFVDGGLFANNPSFIGLLEVLRDMTSDFPNATVEKVNILNIGTLGEEYAISPASVESRWGCGYVRLWGMGERLVLTTMTANQQLQKSMLMRELKANNALENYVYLDDIVPNEAASDITIDNASESSLRNLAGRGKQLATNEFTKNERLRNFFKKQAAPFIVKAPVNQEIK